MMAMTEKLCRKCGRMLTLDAFPPRKMRGKVVTCSPCRQCASMRQSEWHAKDRERNPEKYREAQRKWRAANPGYSGRKSKQPYNPASARKAHKKWRSVPENRRKDLEAHRAYYWANRERILEHKRMVKLKKAIDKHHAG